MKPHIQETKRLGFTDKLKNQVGFSQQQMAVFEPKKKVFWTRVREKFDEKLSPAQWTSRYVDNPSFDQSTGRETRPTGSVLADYRPPGCGSARGCGAAECGADPGR